MKKIAQKGFTLIELMIVIAIIGILAAVAIPNYISFKNKSYCTATVNDIKAVGAALADYFAIPTNVTASVPYNPSVDNKRPYITVGNQNPAANTLFLSASTANVLVTQPGNSETYLLQVEEGTGLCPKSVTNADTHWSNVGATKPNGMVYSMTL